MSQVQPLCWDLPCSVTCYDTGTQHVNREDGALLKGRRMLQGSLEKRMSIEHKAGEIQLIVQTQVLSPCHHPIYPQTGTHCICNAMST